MSRCVGPFGNLLGDVKSPFVERKKTRELYKNK